MKTRFILILGMLALTACSNQSLYHNMQQHQRLDCFLDPSPDDIECLQSQQMDFRQYELLRKGLLEEEHKVPRGARAEK